MDNWKQLVIITAEMKQAIAVLVRLTLIWLLLGLPCWAQGMPTPSLEPRDPQELQAFVDKIFAEQVIAEHIPGAVFILVKDGKIFFSKGYGYADTEKKISVVPDKTLFRVGSISKLFTATAVMQLAAQGKLKLTDDVNQYLQRFQIENKYNQPVTFANLLTHTDGFDSGWGVGAFARSAAEMTPLDDYIAKRLPPRLLPPGEVFLYSDVGMTLAGYLVETISGIPFTQYIEQNILQPLDMRRSSFLQPLPPQLTTDLAVGYKYENGTYQRQPFAFNNSVPAAAFMATATDMAHFAIAHLQNGRYGEAQILNTATAQEMHREQFTHHPHLAGSAYGFYEGFQNNQRSIEHSGRMNGYSSQLFLLPAQNLGLFIACNNNSTALSRKLISQFLARYYPVAEKPVPLLPPTNSHASVHRFSGTYRYNRYSHSTIEKLGAVLGDTPEVQVMASNDGTLSLYSPGNKWVEVEPLLFRSVTTDLYIAFRQDHRGHVTYMFLGNTVFAALEKLAWYETIDFHLKLVGVCGLIFFSACCVWLIGWLIDRFCRSCPVAKIAQPAQLCAVLVSVLNLIFIIGMSLVVFQTDFWDFFFGIPSAAIALLFIPPVTTSLTVGLTVFIVLAWKNKYYSVRWRLYYSLITVAALAFIPFLNYWNLLGFRF